MRSCPVAFGLVALLVAPIPFAYAQDHSHASSPAVATAPAHSYMTDATLRQQMRAVRVEVAAIANAQQRSDTAPEAAAAAGRITAHVNTIIAQCNLPADADEALHAIIGPMLQSAAALQSNPMDGAAVAAIEQELARYGREFDDPGFATRPR